jgi:hypothetical protein
LRPVYFLPHDFNEFIVGLEGEKPKPADAAVRETSQSKRGPKERYDWMAAEKIAIESLDHHGDFTPADPDWNDPVNWSAYCVTSIFRHSIRTRAIATFIKRSGR